MPSRGPSRDSRASRLSRLGAVACTVLVGLVGACSAGPAPRPAIIVNDGQDRGVQPPPTGSAPAQVPPLEEPAESTVTWGACDAPTVMAGLSTLDANALSALRVQCARVNNVLDSPDRPGRGVARLTLLRAGTGRIPILVLNDVSGEPGTIHAARLAASLPPDFLTKFSLVGLDRRGTGGSDAVHCVPEDVRAEMLRADPAGDNVEELLDAARKAGQQCVINLENRLGALDTFRSSSDVERVRQALGMARLNAIGVGEGSRVLTVFADRFPDRVGRMVLDGVPDPTQDSLESLSGVAAGTEAAFTAFATDCVVRSCALGPDPKQALTLLLDQLRIQPLTGADGELTAGAALRAVRLGLANRPQWPALADAMGKARSGDPSGLLAFVQPLLDDSPQQPTRFDIGLVTGCNDTKDRLAVQPMTEAAKDWAGRFPLFGGLMAQQLVLCAAWPLASSPPQAPTAKGAPPILVLSTAGDPITPEQGTQRAAQQLNSAVTVSWAGAGHGALTFSSCATDAARNFLTDGKVPAAGTTCPP